MIVRSPVRIGLLAVIMLSLAATQYQLFEQRRLMTQAAGVMAAQLCDLKHQNEMIKLVNEFLSAHELFEDFAAEWREEAERYHKACHSGAA